MKLIEANTMSTKDQKLFVYFETNDSNIKNNRNYQNENIVFRLFVLNDIYLMFYFAPAL